MVADLSRSRSIRVDWVDWVRRGSIEINAESMDFD